jgi:hypothetical protein
LRKNAFGLPRGTAYKKLEAAHLFQPAGNTRLFSEAGMSTLAREWATLNRDTDNASEPSGKTKIDKPLVAPQQQSNRAPDTALTASPINGSAPSSHNEYKNLAKEWASMNREDDSRSGPAPMPMPAPRTPPAPAAVSQASNPVPATPAAGANVYGNLAKEWASMNREDDSRSGPAPMPMPAPHALPAPAAVTQASNPVPVSSSAGANIYGNLAKEWASMNREDDSRSGPIPFTLPLVATNPAPILSLSPSETGTQSLVTSFDSLAIERADTNRKLDGTGLLVPHAPPGDPHATVKVTEGLIADLNSISIDYGIPDLEEMEVQVDAMINSLKRKDQEYHVTIAQLKAQYERQETELRVKLDTLATDYQAYRSSKESELLDKEKRVEGIKMGFQKELDDLSVKLQQQKELTDQESKRAQVYSARRSELENELSRLQSESAATIRDLENRYNAERDSRSDDLAVAKQRVEELQHESQQRVQEANKLGQEEVRRVKFDLQGRLENKEAELSKARTDLQGAEMDRKQNEARILALTDVNQSLQNVTKATFDLLNRIKKQIFGI